eukprot:CAMPEP_0201692582 /NCGR_PEP_ID=MMETSP0578-20130828/5435_1 /ASSEMBLY_ACC=CAM_ASM_000663 /TAXON_ID=267565 /ORGANISM="Skeletonema grethea, Strain CCMP 1804" /LENGTH=100 /DNA_ID=CAMNT_0048177985 /DNA_START=39 /DNA_END=341 /DNA_ORIENTATION=+
MIGNLLARSGLRAATQTAGRTQRRKMGDGPFTDAMHVKKNKYVEEWNGRREITEKAFEVGPDNLPAILFCAFVFPFGIYTFTRRELIIKGDPRYKRSGLA